MFKSSLKSIFLAVCFINLSQLCYPADKFTLDKNQFTARGRNEAVCTINQYGYYSVFTKSKNGTEFQIIDRMKGPGGINGKKSEFDGRQDILFDEGLYKIRMYSGTVDEGNVTLNVMPFRELNVPEAPLLKNDQYVETSLGDFEQISYWIEVKQDVPVLFEASGRSLSKMCVWKDGTWLVNAVTYPSLDESVEGKPLNVINLCGNFEPGYYKITVYGKEPLKWANEDKKNPLYVRYGAKIISANSRFTDTISSMGKNRYLVEAGANYFLLQAENKDAYKLSVRAYDVGNPDSQSVTESISNKSRTPECKIRRTIGSGLVLMTVTGKAGKKVTLQTMKKEYSFTVKESGKYWLSTLHSGFIGDYIEPEGFLVEFPSGKTSSVINKNLDVLNGRKGWQGKFNLTGEVTLFLDVEEDGNYLFDFAGVDAEVKVERFFLSYPKNYIGAKYKKLKFSTSLEKGINAISIRPVNQGILTLLVRKESLMDFIFKKDSGEKTIKGNLQFSSVELSRYSSYTLYVNNQGSDMDSGMILRKLPLNLDESLPVILKPDEEVSVSFSNNTDESLVIDYYKNNKFTAKLDGNKLEANAIIKKGQHTLSLKNNGDTTEIYSVKTVIPETPESKKPVYLSTEITKSFPKFDTIKTGEEIFFDMERLDRKTFLLNVTKAGIYSLESTGRLRTKATVRTRIITDLYNAESNGVGRNFLLHTYLKEGIYQVTVETLGESKGHLGVTAKYSEPLDGGTLVEGKTFRDALDPGISVLYRFDVTADAHYTLNTIGLNNKKFQCRLEDGDGWPLATPNIDTNFNQFFEKGGYRLFSMPSDVWGRRLTTLTRVTEKKTYKIKEPVELGINEPFTWQWIESEINGKRIGDLYYFNLPSSMNVKLVFTENMIGELYKVKGKDNAKLRDIYPDAMFEGELSDGRYFLELHSQKIDNYTDYSVAVYSDELVDGLTYAMAVPDSMVVSVKENTLVEISSNGPSDVEGALYTLGGEPISFSDDEYNDWNFSLFEYLQGGKYILKIKDAGNGSSGNNDNRTFVSMRTIPEKNGEDMSAPFSKKTDMKGIKNNFKLPKGPGLFSFEITANSVAGVSINEKSGAGEKEILRRTGKKTSFDVFIPAGKYYQLSLWSMDHIDENISVNITEQNFTKISLSDISSMREFSSPKGKAVLSMSTDTSTYSFECLDALTGNRLEDLYYGFQSNPESPVVFEKAEGGVSAGKGILFIKVENPFGEKIKLVSSKTYLDDKTGFITLNKNNPYYFDLKQGKNKIGMLMVKCDNVQPLCGFVTGLNENSFKVESINVSSRISIRDNVSVDIALPGIGTSAKAVVWNPESTINNETANVLYREFEVKTANIDGFIEDRIKDGARIYSVIAGSKKCDISLDEGMTAFAIKNNEITEIFHTTDKPEKFSFKTKADNIGIINYGNSDGNFRIVPVPDDNKSTDASGILYEKNLQSAENTSIFIQPSKLKTKRSLGFSGELKYSLITSDGRMIKGGQSGNENGTLSGEIPIDNSWNLLIIENQPGFAKVWTSNENTSLKDRWGDYSPESPAVLKKGQSVMLGIKPSWYILKNSEESIIDINAGNYSVYTIIKNGVTLQTGEIPGGSDGYFIASPGDYVIGIRQILSGVNTSEATALIYVNRINQIKENETPELLLGNNESRCFTFELNEKQDIGIGFKSESDNITCNLYDSNKELIASSPVIFSSLEKGKYFLVYKITGEEKVLKFYPIIISSSTIEQKIYNDHVREFLITNGFIKSE